MHRRWLQIFVVTQIVVAVLGESQYTIIAPGTIRSNRKYSVGITLHEAKEPATIRVGITSPTTSLNLTRDVTLQPFESKLIDLMLPKLMSQFKYEFKAEGIRGITFNETNYLYALEFGGPRIYVESDRGTYKPGDTVQFRVIILDEHLRPMDIIEPIRVQILDADRNRVKHFKDIQLQRGVFAGSFPISKQPLLGKWIISVYLSGKYNSYEEYKFDVDKYVLPKFSVHLETDPNFVQSERFIKATVYAKYTYGKYVEGTATLSVEDAFIRTEASRQIINISNGTIKSDVYLDISSLGYTTKVVIYATFQEHLTNITASTLATVVVRKEHYNIIVPESSIEFRDDKPYRFKAMVEHWNGTRVTDNTKAMILKINSKKYTTQLDENGVAQFEFDYEPNGDFWIYYDDSSQKVSNIYGPRVSYDYEVQTCKIEMKGFSAKDRKGDPLELKVTANDTIPYLIYMIVSHGNVIRQEYVRLSGDQKTYAITMDVTIDIIPQSYLYVHYIVNNELRYCEFTIRLPQNFENEISVEAPTSVEPGQQITMNIKGKPNSHVSIVAVDKSSLLLNSDNVLKKSTVMKDLLFDRSFRQLRETIYYPGFVSGVLTLTNAKYEPRSIYPYSEPLPTQHTDVYPRSIFPETWIFEDLELYGTGALLNFTVPDTITTWIVRAFSVNDAAGFAMLDTTLDIRSFKPFFISTNLPYAVKRGEVVTIPITIFNYLPQSYETEVLLENEKEEFSFVDEQNRPIDRATDKRKILIPANNGKSVSFVIKPMKVGDIDIRITARHQDAVDTIIQKLKVEPEGLKKQYNQEVTLNLKQGKGQTSKFYAPIPPNIVPESEYIVFSASGDIMTSALENLDNLVLKPSGCGEQNMINLVPNILVLDYLKALNRVANMTKLVNQAKRYIETGYQQELTYRHPGGGYSVFGPQRSSTESNWLTAYVTRFFVKALRYSAIEPKIIDEGLGFLAKQQAENGSFPQRGHLFHPSHQSEYGFTAFVVMAFLEDPKFTKKYSAAVEKGMQFLTSNLDKIKDAYSLAIVANVFQATANSHANEIVLKLKQMASEENGLMWWTTKNKKKGNTNSVEVTAYALMALLETPGHYASVFNWLIKQRNNHGGFGSTQDTVVGLQALIKYAEKSPHASSDVTQLKLIYVAKDERGEKIKENHLEVDEDNQFVLQQQELPRTTRSVDVDVMGEGKIFLQFSYQYYVPTAARASSVASTPNVPALYGHSSPPESQVGQPMPTQPITLPLIVEHEYFSIKPTAKVSSTEPQTLTLAICYSYEPRANEDESLTNMVILQVQFPSSYVANKENVEHLKEEEQVSRVELQNSSTMMVIYFERLEAHIEQCLTIMGDKLHDVKDLQPSTIEMYDYYNPQQRSEVLYEISTYGK